MREYVVALHAPPRAIVRMPRNASLPVGTPATASASASSKSGLLEQFRSDRRLIEQTLARVDEAVRQHDQLRRQQVSEWQQAAIELALTIATRLLHQQVEAGQFPVEELAREMIAPYTQNAALSVYLNPEDVRLLQERLGGRPLCAERADMVRFAPDPTLGRGECRVEDGNQVLLSQLSVQLREMREEMLRSLTHAAA